MAEKDVHLMEGVVYLAYSLRVQFTVAGNSGWQVFEADHIPCIVRKQNKRNAGVGFFFGPLAHK